MSISFDKTKNVLYKEFEPDHPCMMEQTKSYFIYDHQSFITEKDIAFIIGWLLSHVKNTGLLNDLCNSLCAYIKGLEKNEKQTEEEVQTD